MEGPRRSDPDPPRSVDSREGQEQRNGERIAAARRRDDGPRHGPQHVVVDLTNRCNSNCIACWTGSPLLRDKAPAQEWFEQELPGQIAHALLRDLATMGCEIVRFTGGGEPLLHPDFEDLARAAAAHGLRCHVTSNGILLKRLSDPALEAISELTISVWAATPGTYSRLHPNKTGATFDRIVATLGRMADDRRAGARRPEIVIANVIGAMNHHELEAMLELACRVGATRVYFTVVDPIPGCTDGLLLGDAEAADLHDRARRAFDDYRGRVAIDNEGGFLRRLRENDPEQGHYDRLAVDEVPCLVGWFFARVTAGGDVVPCCRAVMRPMGNLRTASFPEIWRAAPYAEFRRHADESRAKSPYFGDIGCVTSCDNLMHNIEWHGVVGEPGPRGPDGR